MKKMGGSEIINGHAYFNSYVLSWFEGAPTQQGKYLLRLGQAVNTDDGLELLLKLTEPTAYRYNIVMIREEKEWKSDKDMLVYTDINGEDKIVRSSISTMFAWWAKLEEEK